MAKFTGTDGPLSDAAFQEHQKQVRAAVEAFDFDSASLPGSVNGFVPAPADNLIEHGLGVMPLRIFVYEADDPEEAVYPAAWVSVSKNIVEVTVTKAYVRVLIDI